MAVPSNPGWKFGYVPSPGEWNNTFAGKVDYPATVDQGGTGGQDAFSGNYNLQQRAQVITPTEAGAALTFYSIRTDLTACALALPLASTCKPGDWIDIFDSGNNASINHITVNAAGSDTILSGGVSASLLLLSNNSARCIFVTDGVSAWHAQSTVPTSAPVPRQIAGTAYTLGLADAGQYLQFTAATDVTVTVPPSGAIPFALGTVIVIEQFGIGRVTLAPGGGVVLNSRNGLKSGGQYAVFQFKSGSNGSADIWTVLGDTNSI